MKKLLRIADVREITDQLARQEISYNKMVELLNERANERLILCDIIERKESLIKRPKVTSSTCKTFTKTFTDEKDNWWIEFKSDELKKQLEKFKPKKKKLCWKFWS